VQRRLLRATCPVLRMSRRGRVWALRDHHGMLANGLRAKSNGGLFRTREAADVCGVVDASAVASIAAGAPCLTSTAWMRSEWYAQNVNGD
jgi:hypothetical protein